MRTVGKAITWLVILAGLGIIVLRLLFFEFPEFHDDAMTPTVIAGDTLVINRRHEPARGEIILFEPPERPGALALRRVVAVPGDSVEVKRGTIRVNGDAIREGLSAKTFDRKTIDGYFVLADNAKGYTDSRHFGPIAKVAVRGTATHVLLPSKARAKQTWFEALK